MRIKVATWSCLLLILTVPTSVGQRTSLILLPAAAPRNPVESQIGRYVPKAADNTFRNTDQQKRFLLPVGKELKKIVLPGRIISRHMNKGMNRRMSGSVLRVTGLPVISSVQDNHKKMKK